MKLHQILAWSATAGLFLSSSTATVIAKDEERARPKRTQKEQRQSGLGQVERADRIIGQGVRSSDNQKIGSVEELVLDLTSGRVLYAVLDTEEGTVAVPPGIFQQSRGRQLRLTADENKIHNAPEFSGDMSRQELARAEFATRVYRHFGVSPWWVGSRPANQGAFENVHKASELEGTEVMNVSNNPVGEIQNVAVDLAAGRIVYVILEPDSDLRLGNNLYAIPPDAFTPGSDEDALTANLDREKLASAPNFARGNWNRLNDQQWAARVYEHFGKQPWFETLEPTGRE